MPLPIVDGHLDLAYSAQRGLDLTRPAPDPQQSGVTLPSLHAGGVRCVLATIFTEPGPESARMPWGYRDRDDCEGAHAAGLRQLSIYTELERRACVRIVRRRRDLEPLDDGGPLRTVILMEGADPIRSAAEVAWWHEQGVRVVGLTWAMGSRWAGGNHSGGPLTHAGRDLVRALDDHGILHDASHLSDEAFDGLAGATRARIVATHSNSRALLEPNERHLRDDHLRRIRDRDGVVGLNLFGKFLASGRPATLEDAIRHLEHASPLIGRERLCLGSDFDGGFTPADCPPGASRPEELPGFIEELSRRGWSGAECASFAHGAWLRVLRAALPG